MADPLRLAASVPQAALILARERPAAIFTTGGYVAIPTMLAAAALRIPVVLWDGNVIPGRSVRVTARLADVLAVSFAATCAALSAGETPCYLTGTPIRATSSVDRVAARERFGIPAGERLLLIFGGSQAVRRFNQAVAEALPWLVERVHVLHVTGDDGYAPALAAREALPEPGRGRYHPHRYLRDEMADDAQIDYGYGTSNALNPNHSYTANGTYNVCLIISTTNACTDTFCTNVVINCFTTGTCTAAFGVVTTACPTIHFNDLSTSSPGTITSWAC